MSISQGVGNGGGQNSKLRTTLLEVSDGVILVLSEWQLLHRLNRRIIEKGSGRENSLQKEPLENYST